MNHKQRKNLARRLSGKQSGMFESNEWEARKQKVQLEVLHREELAKQRAIERKLNQPVVQ